MKKINYGQKDKGQILSKEKIIHQSFGGIAFHVVQKGKTIVLAADAISLAFSTMVERERLKKK